MKLDKLIKLDLTELKSFADLCEIDYSAKNTECYITTSKNPSLRLALIGEELNCTRFIKTACLHLQSMIIGGVWFSTDLTDLTKSKRTIVLSVNPDIVNFPDYESALDKISKYLILVSYFISEQFTEDLANLFLVDYMFTSYSDNNATNDNCSINFRSVLEKENHLTEQSNLHEMTKLYDSLIDCLFAKYCEQSNATSNLYSSTVGYSVTDKTLAEYEEFKKDQSRNDSDNSDDDNIIGKFGFGFN